MGEEGNEGAGEGAVPSERVRKMEVRANEAFDVYRELYYEGGVSSVYFWNLDDGFAGVVLLKKGVTFPFSLPPSPHCGSFKGIAPHGFVSLTLSVFSPLRGWAR